MATTPDLDTVWRHVDHRRRELADVVDAFTEEEWSTPSLCEAWTVREVAAHLTQAHMGLLEAVPAAARAGFGFNRMIRDSALRQSARVPREEYAGRIRAMVGSRRTAPFVTPVEPLTDALVHAEDMLRPLGRTLPMDPEAARICADRVWSTGFPFGARRRLAGKRLVASDADWSVGEGEVVQGSIADLLLLLTGRDPVRANLPSAG